MEEWTVTGLGLYLLLASFRIYFCTSQLLDGYSVCTIITMCLRRQEQTNTPTLHKETAGEGTNKHSHPTSH